MKKNVLFAAVGLAILVLGVVVGRHYSGSTTPDPKRPETPEAKSPAVDVTPVSVPEGYLADAACASCHRQLFDDYQHVGMANSFFRPRADRHIEDFEKDNTFYHELTGRHYKMSLRDGDVWFTRYQNGPDGPIHQFETKVDWVLGSGRQLRTYLYQNEVGELHQLPVAWHTRDQSWAMAPGYHRRDHEGVTRQVKRECLFCHNAYPGGDAGADRYGLEHVFPRDMPQGIGCQRCHGPGAEHAQLAASSGKIEDVRAAIVNPGKLSAELREDVCNQCHLQPNAQLAGVRRFGKGTYDYRPGDSLADYLVGMDLFEQGEQPGERFESNHTSHRLGQSACVLKSEAGELGCVACHDPHHKAPTEQRAAHYRKVCAQCHKSEACTLDSKTFPHPGIAGDDCVSCHMPKRRTADMVHVVATDHRIQRPRTGVDLLAPRGERDPLLMDVRPLAGQPAPEGRLGEIYAAMALSRASDGRLAPAVASLQKLLATFETKDVEPLLALAEGQMKQGSFEAARQTLARVASRAPDHPRGRQWLALTEVGVGRKDDGIRKFRQMLLEEPDNAEVCYNLGVALFSQDRADEALPHLKRATELRPNLVMAWFYLGRTHRKLVEYDSAAEAHRRALSIDPRAGRIYLELGQTLLEAGRKEEAIAIMEHGVKWTPRPGALLQQIAAAGGSSSPDAAGVFGGAAKSGQKLVAVPVPNLERFEESVAKQLTETRKSFMDLAKKTQNSLALAEAFAAMGRLYHAYEIYECAEPCYLNCFRLSPRDYRWPYLLGVVYQQTGRLPLAVDYLRTANELEPRYVAAEVNLGLVYLQLDQSELAQRHFQNALQLDQNCTAAHNGLGDVAAARKEFQEAVARYQTALNQVPAANRIHYSLAMAYRGLGDKKLAEKHLAQRGPVGVRPKDPLVESLQETLKGERIHLILGRQAYHAGRYGEAAEAFKKAVDSDPDSVRARVNWAACLSKLDKHEEAIAQFLEALKREPENFTAHANLGILYATLEQYEKSSEHFKQALAAKPNDLQTLQAYGEALAKAKRYDDALAEYAKALQHAPDFELASLGVCDVLAKQEKYRDQLDLLEKLHKQFPERGVTTHALARFLANCPDGGMRDGKRAVELAKRVYAAKPSHMHAETAASALAEAGDCEQAATLQRQLADSVEKLGFKKMAADLRKELLRYEMGAPCRPQPLNAQ